MTTFCFGQVDYSFSIEQVGLPNGHFSNYQYKSGELLVLENSKRIEKIKLTILQKAKLDSIIFNLNVDKLNSRYNRTNLVFDGTHWNFNFKIDNKEKEIFLDNYYLAQLDNFVRFLNSILPEKAQIISFGKDMYLIPDTVICYLPDLYIDTVILPDTNYNFYSIMCFKKGYFHTEILDSISLCDCRIYPTNKDSKFIKRAYWRAYRQVGGNWKREYFDNDNKVIKIDFIKDILPYEIVKEKTNIDIGNKPSVTIRRYYKTEINDK